MSHSTHFETRVLEYLDDIQHLLREILYTLKRPHRVVRLIIYQPGVTPMATQGVLKGILPGQTGAFAITPVDQNGNPSALPAGVVPVWTSSDTTNAPVTAATDGLSATVAVLATAPTGSFTLSVAATLPDNTVPSGSAPVPILSLEVTAFILTQTA